MAKKERPAKPPAVPTDPTSQTINFNDRNIGSLNEDGAPTYLTPPLSQEELAFLLTGPEGDATTEQKLMPEWPIRNLRTISKYFKGLPLAIQENRVVASSLDVDGLAKKDPGYSLRLQAVFTGLVALVQEGHYVTEKMIRQAVYKATQSELDMTGGIVTKQDGMIWDTEELPLPGFEKSQILKPTATLETCREDGVEPRLSVSFNGGEGQKIMTQVVGEKKGNLAEFSARMNGLRISTDRNQLVFQGREKTLQAMLPVFLKFVTLVMERGYKKPKDCALALKCAFGEIKEETLPENLSTKGLSVSENTSYGVRDGGILAKTTLNLYPPATEHLMQFDWLIKSGNHFVVVGEGCAGTGKTVGALQAAVELLQRRAKGDKTIPFEQIYVTIPFQPVGRDIGFLPGDVSEKTDCYMNTFLEPLARMLGPKDSTGRIDVRKGMGLVEKLLISGVIQKVPLTFLRGKSIPNTLLIVDEAQNLLAEDIKTIICRPEATSRIVVTGHLRQVDLTEEERKRTCFQKLYSPFSIDRDGNFIVEKKTVSYNLGPATRFGAFVKGSGAGTIGGFYPEHGLATALYYAAANPKWAFVKFGLSDVVRSDDVLFFQALDEACEDPKQTLNSELLGASGEGDHPDEIIKRALAARDAQQEAFSKSMKSKMIVAASGMGKPQEGEANPRRPKDKKIFRMPLSGVQPTPGFGDGAASGGRA